MIHKITRKTIDKALEPVYKKGIEALEKNDREQVFDIYKRLNWICGALNLSEANFDGIMILKSETKELSIYISQLAILINKLEEKLDIKMHLSPKISPIEVNSFLQDIRHGREI